MELVHIPIQTNIFFCDANTLCIVFKSLLWMSFWIISFSFWLCAISMKALRNGLEIEPKESASKAKDENLSRIFKGTKENEKSADVPVSQSLPSLNWHNNSLIRFVARFLFHSISFMLFFRIARHFIKSFSTDFFLFSAMQKSQKNGNKMILCI